MENTSPQSWVNPMLQLLFALPHVRKRALATQLSSYHHSNPTTLYGELGFLFDMMLSIRESSAQHPTGVSRVVTTSNFHRSFRSTPEALSSGLFHDLSKREKDRTVSTAGLPLSPSLTPISVSASASLGGDESPVALLSLGRSVSDGSGGSVVGGHEVSPMSSDLARRLQQSVQTFTRFILQQLKKEFELEQKFSTYSPTYPMRGGSSSQTTRKAASKEVSDESENHFDTQSDGLTNTFSFETSTISTFVQSHTATPATRHVSSAIELNYPQWQLSPPSSTPLPSFSETFHGTLFRHSQLKGWCAKSESYEHCKQSKRVMIDSLSDVFTVLCGDTVSHPQQHQSKQRGGPNDILFRSRNRVGGPWLPDEIEVPQQCDHQYFYHDLLVHMYHSE